MAALLAAGPSRAGEMILYDGETPKTDLDRANGGPYYETWWGGTGANAMTDSGDSPRAGKKCLKWECTNAWSGGAFMADPNWMGLNIEPVTAVSLWARGGKGGESVVLELFDRNLGKPAENDGFFNKIEFKGLTTEWKKYEFPLAELQAGREGRRPLDLRIFEGAKVSGSPAGTVVYLDDFKLLMKERAPVVYAPLKINKLGYLPSDRKWAVVNRKVQSFRVVDVSTGKATFTGKPVYLPGKDPESGDLVGHADFTSVKTPGRYRLELADGTKSPEFPVGDDVYRQAWIDMIRTYYYQRCGTELKAPYAEGRFTHEACHPDDAKAGLRPGNDGKTSKDTFDMTGGWHDAGDDNKYSWNYGFLFNLVRAWEVFPEKFPDGLSNIPESGNGRSDLLDELAWETKWYVRMQVPSGPEAGLSWEQLRQNDGQDKVPNLRMVRTLKPPTTAATSDYCAAMAMMARVFSKEEDADSQALAKLCRERALKAWKSYLKFSKDGTVSYPDGKPLGYDPFKMKAAAELYALTGAAEYHDVIRRDLPAFIANYRAGDIRWGQDKFLPIFVYCAMPEDRKDPAVEREMKDLVRAYRGLVDEYVAANGYRVPFGHREHFCWGSNGHLSSNGVIFYHLYLWDRKEEDLLKVKRVVDYLFGLNAVDQVMLTGSSYGKCLLYHGIWARTEDPAAIPPGYLPGGVNMHNDNSWMSPYPQKCFRESITNWSVNENSIGYQAPAIFCVTAFVP